MIIDGLEINNWSRPVIEEVRSGGVDIVHATVGVWEDTAAVLQRIGAMRHLIRNNADIARIVTSVEEMQQAKSDGVLGLLFGFQNSSMIGDDPELVGMFSDIGIKCVQLTYNIANHLGSSCYEPNDGGLTLVGNRIVQACNDFGVLIDISHVGNRTGRDAVESSRDPIAVTHGNPRSFHDAPRNKPDDILRAVAERGGMIGVTLYPLFMGGSEVPRSAYCQMIADLVQMVGIEGVGIGTDAVLGWDPDALGWMRNGRWNRPNDEQEIPSFPAWPHWFSGPKDFPSLAEGLDEIGFLPDERDKILGGNWLRLFGEVIG